MGITRMAVVDLLRPQLEAPNFTTVFEPLPRDKCGLGSAVANLLASSCLGTAAGARGA